MKRTVKTLTICATLALLLVCGVLFYQMLTLTHLKKTSRELDSRMIELKAIETSINDGIAMRQSDAYKQQEIRDSLGMIKDNEQIIIIK